MRRLKDILEFLQANQMEVVGVNEDIGLINIGGRNFIYVDGEKMFDSNMYFNAEDYQYSDAEDNEADFCFEFGGNYYWVERNAKEVQFNDLRYIGNVVQDTDYNFAHLGVHGGYEIMNGSGSYKTWCKKAKFFGHKALGICEHNTLAGAVAFQNECKDVKIKPIIGMTVTAVCDWSPSWKHKIKLYAKDEKGWRNLLKIHRIINVDGDGGTVDINMITSYSDGLIVVFGWGLEVTTQIYRLIKQCNVDIYYQIDSIEYADPVFEQSTLNNVKKYVESYISEIPPVLINDTYYIDRDYSHIKAKLNSSSNKFHNKCKNAHYKNCDETFLYLAELFKEDDDRLYDIFKEAVSNTIVVADKCSYTIEIGVVKMPRFEPDKLEGKYSGYTDNEELFLTLIADGLEKVLSKVPDDRHKEYLERVDKEVKVITKGGFIDYFLIVWDIINWSVNNGIYVGIGRGSAGGCMVSYLLGITKFDPIQFPCLFERFMNEGRLAGGLPDIDCDFEGLRRDDVKRYIERRYGAMYVCSIGTYSKLRVKAAMNEMWVDRSKLGTVKYMTAMINDRDGDWDEIFRSANKKKPLKEFVLDNVKFINDVRIVLDQPKNVSIHAAGVVIVPKEDKNGNPMTIFDWMPVTKRDGVLISEWEGAYLEKCGFMKNDILGTRQLDKFRFMTNLIEETTGEKVDIYNIPLDDDTVYAMFQEGNTEDTFHFGSPGLKSYTRTLKPKVMEDLIDTISLHRPALMDIGTHKDFVNIRFGRAKVHYDFGLKEITKNTNGILLYQEQVMEAVKQIGGFTMAEADDVRRAMGKKKIEVIAPYKKQFVEGAIKRGCPKDEAEPLWNKLELFSGYGFNVAHATAYAMTGYIGMWFKVHYPLHFWTAAFQYAKDEDIPKFVSEINRIKQIRILPPDINTSDGKFSTDYDNRAIKWSLNKIKQVGDVATEEVLNERVEKGRFYDIDEFFSRVTRKKVNRKVITSLIFSGCMDSMYDISYGEYRNRGKIIRDYANLIGDRPSSMMDLEMAQYEYWWSTKQKLVSGLGIFDYESIVKDSGYKGKNSLIDPIDLQMEENVGAKKTVCGLIVNVGTHKGSKGEFANILLDINEEQVYVTCWPDVWKDIVEDIVVSNTAKLLIISGRIEFDSFKGVNVIATTQGSQAMVIDTKIEHKSVLKS